MSERPMSKPEREAVTPVFKATIPYDRVVIKDGLGLGQRPYTVPSAHPNRYFNIFLGSAFRKPLDDPPNWLIAYLVHELVHVWQSFNNGSALAYAIDSMVNQGCMGKRAYVYEVGLNWSQYNVEQQAHIVEDWYLDGKQVSDPKYRYIRDNLWHPEKREGFSKQDLSGILQ